MVKVTRVVEHVGDDGAHFMFPLVSSEASGNWKKVPDSTNGLFWGQSGFFLDGSVRIGRSASADWKT